MRAIVLDGYGEPDVLHPADVESPDPGPGQVRVVVGGSSVNPVDLSTRAGLASGAIPDPVFPMVLGWDASGRVDAVGEGVTKFSVGDRVIGVSVWFVTRRGTYADQVVLDEDACALAPAGIDDVHACTLPLNGLTAWSAVAVAAVEPGDTLLVTGAAGAVGGFAVQLSLPFDRLSGTALDAALDDVREKFGSKALTRAVLLGRDEGFSVPMLPD